MPTDDDRINEELTALADGTLQGRRRAQLLAEIGRSPELAGRYEKQRRAVAALRSVDDRAPAWLRARLEPEPRRRKRWRPSFSLPLAGGLAAGAAFAILLALLLPGGAGGPTVVEASELAAQPAEAAAPGPVPSEPALLDARAEGLAFPNWAEEFGWRATGRREDEIDGRRAVTVFYEKGGRRIGYTILSGDPIDAPDEASTANREGVILRGLSADGRMIVTWLRGGHTCVLSGMDVDVDAGTLLDLAAWQGKGAVEF
jgi:anti-sigma factor RsiW